ncbi:MAG: hypothetical protein ABL967_16055 [Bryobacteraceae bacterium]
MNSARRQDSFPQQASPTVFYSKGRFDRSGAQVHEDLMAYSFCFHHGYSYGGAIGGAYFDEHFRLCQFLGLPLPKREGEVSLLRETYRELRWEPSSGQRPHGMTPWARLLAFVFRMEINDQRLLDVDSIYSPAFRTHLRRSMRLNDDRGDVPNAVVHIRRGDIRAPEYAHRYLDNAYYLRLIQKIQASNASARIIIHSENDSPETFDAFLNLGCTVKLDSSLEEAWQDMILADVLVLSKSSFSYVPALFNSNLVLYTPFWHNKLCDWIDVSADNVEAALAAHWNKTMHVNSGGPC